MARSIVRSGLLHQVLRLFQLVICVFIGVEVAVNQVEVADLPRNAFVVPGSCGHSAVRQGELALLALVKGQEKALDEAFLELVEVLILDHGWVKRAFQSLMETLLSSDRVLLAVPSVGWL